MTEKIENADSGAKEKVSENGGNLYQPPSGENADDKQTPTGEQGNGQESQEQVPGEGKKQEVLTEASISEIVAREVKEGMRQFQSMSDKSEARVKQLISDNEARMEKTIGRDLTTKEKTVLEGGIREEVRTSSEVNTDAQESDVFKPSLEAQQEFASKVQVMEIKYGVRLLEEDEENKTVNWNEQDHLKLLPQIESAMKAKAGKGQSDDSVAQSAASRLPTPIVGSTPDNMKGKSPNELLNIAHPIPK